MISIPFILFCVFFIITLYLIRMAYRNGSVYALRTEITDEVYRDLDYASEARKVYLRYSYDYMMLSLRTIKSFRNELLGDISKIKQGGKADE